MDRAAEREAQLERAQQRWELIITVPASESVVAAARRVLRIKRFEIQSLSARLPGVVRRGARIDLEPLRAALEEAGVPVELRRRADPA